MKAFLPKTINKHIAIYTQIYLKKKIYIKLEQCRIWEDNFCWITAHKNANSFLRPNHTPKWLKIMVMHLKSPIPNKI